VTSSKRHATIMGWGCALLLVLCVLAMNPRAEIGLHDDWSYIYSAKRLAETGHVTYNGWATAMLGWQLYLGALFIRIFGFSFTVVRFAIVLVAMLVAPLSQAIFLRLGVRPWHATIGTLTFVLSPLFLPLAMSFMSDVPSVFCLLLCLYGCLRAVQAVEDRTAMWWLAFAALSNLAGGTVRQIAWLGVLVMVPTTAWLLRRRRGMLLFGALLWVLSFACILLMMHWFNHQPYTSVERLIAMDFAANSLVARGAALVKCVLTLDIFVLPILLGFAWQAVRPGARQRTALGVTLAGIVALILGLTALRPNLRWMTMLLGDYVSPKGILELPWLLGTTPDAVPVWGQALFAILVFTVSAAALTSLLGTRSRAGQIVSGWKRSTPIWLMGPFTVAYLFLIVSRAAMFDRYLLPVIFVLISAALLFYERTTSRTLPAACLLLIALFAGYGIAGSHDIFAAARARLLAADTLRNRGVPRNELRAGFEYDGWTQIELTGHVNESRIHVPAGAYHPWTAPKALPSQCIFWFQNYTPSIHARYELSNQPGVCFPDAHIPPVRYTTWLPPHQRSIYFVELPEALR
jgi:hypothetical protein